MAQNRTKSVHFSQFRLHSWFLCLENPKFALTIPSQHQLGRYDFEGTPLRYATSVPVRLRHVIYIKTHQTLPVDPDLRCSVAHHVALGTRLLQSVFSTCPACTCRTDSDMVKAYTGTIRPLWSGGIKIYEFSNLMICQSFVLGISIILVTTQVFHAADLVQVGLEVGDASEVSPPALKPFLLILLCIAYNIRFWMVFLLSHNKRTNRPLNFWSRWATLHETRKLETRNFFDG